MLRAPLLSLMLLTASGALQAADGLSFAAQASATRTETFNPAPFDANLNGLASGAVQLGQLLTTRAGTLSFSYLGQESGYANEIHFAGRSLTEAVAVGTTISGLVGAGAVDFRFLDNNGGVAFNTSSAGTVNWTNATSVGLLGQDLVVAGQRYAMVLGFNDRGGAGATSGDWDDYVVGVNFVATPVSEPASLSLLAAGLALLGAVKRRRPA